MKFSFGKKRGGGAAPSLAAGTMTSGRAIFNRGGVAKTAPAAAAKSEMQARAKSTAPVATAASPLSRTAWKSRLATKGSPSFTGSELAQGYRKVKE